MKITVIIPTYRRPDMVVQCLESVLKQTRPVEAIVIVDDNAGFPEMRAQTRAAVEGMAIKIPLQYLTPPLNIGLASARNLALEVIPDGLVAFLDDDDSWENNKLELYAGAFEITGADVVYSDHTVYDATLQHSRGIEKMNQVTGSFFDTLFASNVVGPPSSIVVRREKCLPFDGRFSTTKSAMEDYDWLLRMAAGGTIFHHLPFPLLRYRSSPTGRINSTLEPWVKGSRLMYRQRLKLARSPDQAYLARRIYYGDLIHYKLRQRKYLRFFGLTAGYFHRFGIDVLLLKRFRNFIANRLKAFRS